MLTICFLSYIPRTFLTIEIPHVAHVTTISSSPMSYHHEPNPPLWPDSVILVKPLDEFGNIDEHTLQRIQEEIEDSQTMNDTNNKTYYDSGKHFSLQRRAVLLFPGVYNVDIEVGYYSQLLGLGKKASDVRFTSHCRGPFVEALNKHQNGRGTSLDTFWRGAENFLVESQGGMMWAVSQAAPLRRVHVATDLYLHDNGAWASGGVLANAIVEGKISFGSQQQWLCRSVNFTQGPIDGFESLAAWSNVFVDCLGRPEPRDGKKDPTDSRAKNTVSVTVDDQPTLIIDKPFISLQKDGSRYDLNVPLPRMKKGPDLDGESDMLAYDFDMVKVVSSNHESASWEHIQSALDDGKHILLTPGIFHFDQTLVIKHHNQVLLGIGMATLVAPVDGSPCIKVIPGLEGVRIAGIMLEASEINRTSDDSRISSLLEWGDHGEDDPGNSSNPGALHDIFARVGGSPLKNELDDSSRLVSTDVMIRIHSGWIYGDNLWLWRADHLQGQANFPDISEKYYQTVLGDVPVKSGLHVHGDHVCIHGLAVEHTNEDHVLWTGNYGEVQFFQSELPYDVDSNFAIDGHVAYRIHDDVTHHRAGGLGIYSNFRDFEVPVYTAIIHPTKDKVILSDLFTFWLNNNGRIKSVSNGLGETANNVHDLCRL